MDNQLIITSPALGQKGTVHASSLSHHNSSSTMPLPFLITCGASNNNRLGI
jgi:hypothetical protein